MYWYPVTSAWEYIVITGRGIKDIEIKKSALILPGQSYTKFDVTPVIYTLEVQVKSALPFVLNAVFSIGPNIDDHESFLKYAKLIVPHGKHSNVVEELIERIVEGEIRVLAPLMTKEDLSKGAPEFKKELCGKLQKELNLFGLWIYNANAKKHMEAANQAKIDVSEATATKGLIVRIKRMLRWQRPMLTWQRRRLVGLKSSSKWQRLNNSE